MPEVAPAGPAGGQLPSERLAALGMTLPPVAAPLAAYRPAVVHAGLAYSAGQLPLVAGALTATGRLGAELDAAQGAACARVCALNALAAIAAETGGLDSITRIVKVVVFVAGTVEFTAQPAVANGASELLGQVFGEQGRHARSAVGVTSLPLGAPVEVEIVAAVRSV